MLSISSNSSLFAILGIAFGGDGRTNFALPDLRSCAALGAGKPTSLPSTQFGSQQAIKESTGAKDSFGTLGLNYIICIDGIFPARS